MRNNPELPLTSMIPPAPEDQPGHLASSNREQVPTDEAHRHASERAFFDALANEDKLKPLSRFVLARYADAGVFYHRELAFKLLGELGGKTVLDVGCGEGENLVLLSKFGARVTGLDISPKAIDVARRRCTLNNITAEFICGAVEHAELDQYDVVWIYTLLHHFVDNLEGVLPKLVACTRPGGRIIITEPVSLSPLLRSFRLKYFAAPVGTPHERPLEPKDIDVIERHVPGFKIRYYRATSRLDRVILPDRQLESAAWWRVGLFRSLCALDYAALSIPFCHRAASMAVMWGESE